MVDCLPSMKERRRAALLAFRPFRALLGGLVDTRRGNIVLLALLRFLGEIARPTHTHAALRRDALDDQAVSTHQHLLILRLLQVILKRLRSLLRQLREALRMIDN